MAIDGAYLYLMLVLASAITWAWLNGPAKLAAFIIMCFSDKVNLVNIIAAVTAFNVNLIVLNLGLIKQVAELAKDLTAIAIFLSAIVVLAYNIVKFYRIYYKKDEEL